MRRIVLTLASLLAGTACSAPTAPARGDAARAERARAALEGATRETAAATAGVLPPKITVN